MPDAWMKLGGWSSARPSAKTTIRAVRSVVGCTVQGLGTNPTQDLWHGRCQPGHLGLYTAQIIGINAA